MLSTMTRQRDVAICRDCLTFHWCSFHLKLLVRVIEDSTVTVKCRAAIAELCLSVSHGHLLRNHSY